MSSLNPAKSGQVLRASCLFSLGQLSEVFKVICFPILQIELATKIFKCYWVPCAVCRDLHMPSVWVHGVQYIGIPRVPAMGWHERHWGCMLVGWLVNGIVCRQVILWNSWGKLSVKFLSKIYTQLLRLVHELLSSCSCCHQGIELSPLF